MLRALWDRFDHLAWAIAAPAVALLTGYPLALIVIQTVRHKTGYSVAVISQVLRAEQYYRPLLNTLVVSAIATVISVLLGAVLAWIVARLDIPGRAWLKVGLTLPYLIPAFIFAFAWRELLGPVGYVNKAFMALSGSDTPLFSIYGPDGIILAFVLHGYPLVYLATISALENMSPALEEAAEVAGAGTLRVMRDITLPLITPAIAAGSILCFTSFIANFGIPAILGIPGNYFVLTTRIYVTVLSYGVPNNLSVAAILSLYLVAMGGMVLAIQNVFFRGRSFVVITGKGGRRGLVQISRWRWPVATVVLIVFFLTAVAPIAAIVVSSLVPGYGRALTWESLSLANYRRLVTLSFARSAAHTSLFLAIGASTLCTFLGLLVAYLAERTRMPLRRAIAGLAGLPRAIPGTILALGFILAWIRPIPLLGISLYNTIWIMLLAYLCKFLTLSERTISASLQQVSVSLEEAVFISGGSRADALRDVLVPLVRPGLLAGWLLVFVPAFNDLTISALLYSSGNETVGVAVFTLLQEGYVTTAAALAVVIISGVFIANQVVKVVTRGRISLLG